MNILMTAATNMEMQAYVEACGEDESKRRGEPIEKTAGKTAEKTPGKKQVQLSQLVTGIGPVETTLSLTRYLLKTDPIDCIINFGIAGAYWKDAPSMQAGLLDICLAEQEILGDLGIQLTDTVKKFSEDLPVQDNFSMDPGLLSAATQILKNKDINYKTGAFVTVNCASGTLHRGNQLGYQFCGLCENMEGAAVARVGKEFSLPCLEIRCISNMVEDRNRENWQLQEACAKVGRTVATIAMEFASEMRV
ncbi:futalosine hydrolase [Candidatus Electrothrix sp.]|uniref:futalosine hydrolase n=1 Tax=Candidatus Electrothrix sp. TaxID=2170559 RepID=UPI004056FA36